MTYISYLIDVDDRPGVLLRILSTCNRRQCDVVAVDYLRGDRHRPPRLRLTVAADARLGPLLTEKLRGLVDVRAVEVEARPMSIAA